jgi:hypothetical protein
LTIPLLFPVETEAKNGGSTYDGADRSDPLVGTWTVKVTFDPATVPPTVEPTFTRLDTYAPGGVLIESNNGPGAGGPGGQGNWVRVGHLHFATTELRLGFDEFNQFTGMTEIRTDIQVHPGGNEFTAQFVTEIYSAEGNPGPFHPAGTFHGTRLPVEPLH